MLISNFLKIDEISNIERDCDVIKRAMSRIPRKNILVNFCDYVENVDFNSLAYLEKLIVCKLRKDLNRLYLKIKFSKIPQDVLINKVVNFLEGGMELVKKESNDEILDKLIKFTDDDCYSYIYEELMQAVEYVTCDMTLKEGEELLLNAIHEERVHLIDELTKAKSNVNFYEEKLDKIDFNIHNLERELEASLFDNKKKNKGDK